MKKFLRNRGLAAVVGSFMLVLGSGNAAAQSTQANAGFSFNGFNAGRVDTSARPLGSTASVPVVSAVQRTITSTTNMFSNAVGAVFGAQPTMQSQIASLAREANWLHNAGWPLYALADRFGAKGFPLDEQATCLATAVYFEARGESVEGQLAVADVVMNRAASGQYPSTLCDVVKQPWQFSFVQHGQFPAITDQQSWQTAQGVARLAMANVMRTVPTDVLWYHADYVAPSWGARLSRVEKIGVHIFYRA